MPQYNFFLYNKRLGLQHFNISVGIYIYTIDRNHSSILECTTNPTHSAETKLIYSTNKKKKFKYFFSLTLTTTHYVQEQHTKKKNRQTSLNS